jgi:hypothetical protein
LFGLTNHFKQISNQPARLAGSVRTGHLQSIPSHTIESCAGVTVTAPSCVIGQTNLPRSNRFA